MASNLKYRIKKILLLRKENSTVKKGSRASGVVALDRVARQNGAALLRLVVVRESVAVRRPSGALDQTVGQTAIDQDRLQSALTIRLDFEVDHLRVVQSCIQFSIL